MDRDRVFIGYDSDLKRCLLYKTKSNQKTKSSYIDLETGNTYGKSEIVESLLISYNQLIKLDGYSSKRKIKKEFQKDENKILFLNDVFIGDIYQVTEITNRTYFGRYLFDFGEKVNFDLMPVFYNRLVRRELFDDYIDLFTNEVYNDGDINVGSFRVIERKLRPFNQVFDEDNMKLPKRKILQIYQEKFDIKKGY